MTATQFMYAFSAVASPWLIALMRRRTWSEDVITVVSVVFAAACFLFGQFADGLIGWPPTNDFWLGLAATYGLQTAGYQAAKRAAPNALAKVEAL